jgi:tRNA(fMet)-specific endonuclease VapC
VEIKNILIDTNGYAAFRRGEEDAVEIIRHVPLIGLSIIVLGELLSGFAVGTLEEKKLS